MPALTTRTFRSGNSTAVRLPKEIAFPEGVELTIVRSGDVLTMYPKKKSLQWLAQRLLELPGPGYVEVRDDEPLPEREGL